MSDERMTKLIGLLDYELNRGISELQTFQALAPLTARRIIGLTACLERNYLNQKPEAVSESDSP